MLLTNAVDAAGRPVELYAKEGKIAAVGQGLAALADPEDLVLDAGGLTVLPAFVDLHCHWRTLALNIKRISPPAVLPQPLADIPLST